MGGRYPFYGFGGVVQTSPKVTTAIVSRILTYSGAHRIMSASAISAVSWEVLLLLDWERQFETFLEAVGGNVFTATRKKALLLHSVGAEALRVFRSQPPAIKATGEDDEDDYATAMRQIRCFYSSQVNVIVERFSFRRRRQRGGVSTAEYVAELWRLPHNCQFGALAEDMIRDQVVEKTVHPKLRERFLQNNNLTLDVVVTQAEAYECSMRESREMGEP
ncbi:hypothetical protein O3P69_005264 [Scylla paramamosain]|uniref:Uncharacterized protein n=1 Tax=Scylla paramamosain TaxID=85552 RepID=A0AAW0UBH7_SCYPA